MKTGNRFPLQVPPHALEGILFFCCCNISLEQTTSKVYKKRDLNIYIPCDPFADSQITIPPSPAMSALSSHRNTNNGLNDLGNHQRDFSGVSPLEQEVLDEYARLASNMEKV